MPIETNLNQSPFYDDFNEAKNFHRVLFRPGYAVQARELTQLQTILQNQIERGFNEILKDGTVISGVQVLTENVGYVKVRDRDANNRSIVTSDFFTLGKLTNAIAVGATSGITAQIIDLTDGSEAAAATGGNFTLFVNYMDSGTDKATKTFADNEVITVRLRNTSGTAAGDFVVAANTIVTSSTGKGFRAIVGEGIVYNKGNFIRVAPQSVIVQKYNTTPTKLLGFETIESTVNSNEDASLLDNATGATNFAAPGAERLKLSPTLTSRVAITANTDTFFPIANIENGLIIRDRTDTELADLGKFISDRIYETNGDYVTKPFNLRIREHLKSADNLGRYNAGSTPAGNSDKLIVEIEPGVGYVRGNRIETGPGTIFRGFDKATDFETKDARTLSQSFGNYVIVDECVGPFDFRSLRTISLRSGAATAISLGSFGTTSAPGSPIGTAKVRGFEYHSGTSGTSTGQYRVYLFDIKMNSTKSFSTDVKSLYFNGASGVDSVADCVLESNKAILKETNLNKLIWSFAQNGTKTLKDASNAVDTQWVTRKANKVTFDADSNRQGTLSIANTATGGTEVMSDSVQSATDRKKFIVQTTMSVSTASLGTLTNSSGVNVTGSGTSFQTHLQVGDIIIADSQTRIVATITSQTALTTTVAFNPVLSSDTYVKNYPIGHIFDFATYGTSSADASSTSRTINIGGVALVGNWTGEVFYNVSRTSAVGASKTINKNKYIHLNLSNNAATTLGPWSLGVPDVMKIRKVWKGTATGVTAANGVDVTTHFLLDTGQTDSFYGTSKLRKKTSSSLALTSSDGLLVEFDYFTMDISSGIGFFSVDSYPIDDANSASTSAIMTKDIPVHVSPSTGTTIDLRDSVDFRQYLAATVTPTATATAAGSPTNPAVLTAITHNAPQGSYVPSPDENFQCDVQYYLPRKDNVILTALGDVQVVKGLASLNPRTPFETNESMILGTMDIPVFPSLSSHVAKQAGRRDYEVRLDLKDNRRYTMKDLRGVASRVKHLEYYASLNSLEAASKNKQIFNSSGSDRFKNGFFVDNFDGHNNADINAEGYRAAIDINKSQLRPVFRRKDIGLRKSTTQTGTNVTQTGNLITLSYTNTSFMNQRKATKLRNPAESISFNWRGKLTLNPEIDNTPDVTTLPDVQVDFDGIFDSVAALTNLITDDSGIIFGDFETVNTSTNTTQGNRRSVVNNGSGIAEDITTTTITDQIRRGTQVDVSPAKNVFEIGNFIESVSTRDYMRSRNLKVTGFGFRPNTRVYSYFDDELVSDFVTPANSSHANTNIEGSSVTTDAAGTVYANFRIPSSDALKFRVGERRFEFKDVANTQTQSDLVSTSGHATYVSSPLDITQKGTSINITTPEISTSSIIQTQTLTSSTTSTINVDVNGGIDGGDGGDDGSEGDPLAQTFIVQTGDTSEGVFITKLDLFFGKKSSLYPVTVELREVENGDPTTTILPYSRKTLLPSQITASSTVATNATTFTFDSPVYLRNGLEYCIIVRPSGASAEYALWVAELGGTDVDTLEGVYKVPNQGIMLVSSNDRTWSPYQKEDLKFHLHRANFSTSGTIYMENEDIDMFSIDSISGPGFNQGEKVTAESVLRFANVAGQTTFTVGQIIQNHQAKVKTANTQLYANGVIRQIVAGASGSTYVKIDAYGTFTASANVYIGTTKVGTTTSWAANTSSGTVDHYDQDKLKLRLNNSTGSFANGYVRGQSSGHTAYMNIANTTPDNAIMSMTMPKVPMLNFKDTSSAWGLRSTSGSGVIGPAYTSVNLSENNYFRDAEKKFYSKTNESALSIVEGNKKTYVLKGTLSTTNTKMSPVIHAGKSNAIIIENVINNTKVNEHLEVGDAAMRFITKPIVLGKGNDAEDLQVFVQAYKPIGTEIYVYAKLLNNEDGEPFKDKSYSPMVQVTSDSTFSDSVNVDDIKEFEYGFSANTTNGFLTSGGSDKLALLNSSDSIVAYEDSSGGVYKGYKTFAIKIVMTSTSTNIIPLAKDVRAIALQI